MTRQLLVLTLLAVPARAAVVAPDAPCMSFGDHTEAIPDFDPVTRTCRSTTLEDPAAFSAAWDKVLAKVRETGGRMQPVEDDVLEWGRGRGNVVWASLDEARHWGDVAYIHMKHTGDSRMPVGAILVTFRAWRSRDMLQATRMDFQAGGDGRLRAVHVWHGVKLPGAPAMAWSQGPVSTINQDSMLDGWWTIRFRQLVASWAAE